MAETNISWAKSSWNPFRWNCTPVSPGCANCYAHDLTRRYPTNANEGNFLAPPALRENAWDELRKLNPGPVFVGSMSDTYHESVPDDWIHLIHNTARQYPHLTFLLLTKRIERAAAMAPVLDWPGNLWIGTTVESASYLWRLDYLRGITQAAGRFVSFEPLLGEVTPDLTGIEWAIVGGESGMKRRAFDRAWLEPIYEACQEHGAAFFFKQGSDRLPGRDRWWKQREWNETPPGIVVEHAQQVEPETRQLALFTSPDERTYVR